MSTTRTAVEDAQPARSECWCCGAIDDPTRLVHLGNHPEVALCIRCAHSVSKWAWEIEDQSKSGPFVMARDRFRAVRRNVISHGWHRTPFVGGPIRWIGKRLP
jgi:hypothetical protein